MYMRFDVERTIEIGRSGLYYVSTIHHQPESGLQIFILQKMINCNISQGSL